MITSYLKLTQQMSTKWKTIIFFLDKSLKLKYAICLNISKSMINSINWKEFENALKMLIKPDLL